MRLSRQPGCQSKCFALRLKYFESSSLWNGSLSDPRRVFWSLQNITLCISLKLTNDTLEKAREWSWHCQTHSLWEFFYHSLILNLKVWSFQFIWIDFDLSLFKFTNHYVETDSKTYLMMTVWATVETIVVCIALNQFLIDTHPHPRSPSLKYIKRLKPTDDPRSWGEIRILAAMSPSPSSHPPSRNWSYTTIMNAGWLVIKMMFINYGRILLIKHHFHQQNSLSDIATIPIWKGNSSAKIQYDFSSINHRRNDASPHQTCRSVLIKDATLQWRDEQRTKEKIS